MPNEIVLSFLTSHCCSLILIAFDTKEKSPIIAHSKTYTKQIGKQIFLSDLSLVSWHFTIHIYITYTTGTSVCLFPAVKYFTLL